MATATRTSRTASAPGRRTEAVHLPRTTGALSGALIILLGLWGGLVPFFGPYFHYAFGGFQTWHYTSQRLWLCIVPGAVAVIGGLMLMRARTRVGGLTAGWVALAAGVWFAVGPSVSLLWHHSNYPIGAPAGGYTRQMLEWVGYFYGLGAAIIGLAAFAMGRYFSRPRIAEDAVVAAEAAPAAEHRTAAGPVAGAAAADRAAYDRPGDAEYDRRAETPMADRAEYDRPAEETTAPRQGYEQPADAPAARTDAPATATDSPAATTDAPATATDAPATSANAPATSADAPATSGDAPATTTYRRRPGLLRRLRG